MDKIIAHIIKKNKLWKGLKKDNLLKNKDFTK
jgi:hypothetical protein